MGQSLRIDVDGFFDPFSGGDTPMMVVDRRVGDL